MGYDPPTTPSAERRAIDEHRAVVAQAEAAFPCLFQALEDQGGVGADAERVLTFHLADLFHQCGRAMLFVELHIHLVDGPGAEERVGVVPAGAHQSHDAQKEKNSTFHDAKIVKLVELRDMKISCIFAKTNHAMCKPYDQDHSNPTMASESAVALEPATSTVTEAVLAEECLSLEESKKLVVEMVHRHYHPEQ